MICFVCHNRGTVGGCWKCGKRISRSIDNSNLWCKYCGWELKRDGDKPKEEHSEYLTIYHCPKCDSQCLPFCAF